MRKYLKKSALVSFLTAGALMITNQIAFAEATCTVNGEQVPCPDLSGLGALLGLGMGFVFVMIAFGIWATVFWIMMIVHAAQHDVENKPMWIILMVFTGIIGALIYYFVVKRHYIKPLPPTATQ